MKKIIDMLKSMTNSKKKVFALALATCVIVLSIAGSSIAYFTDTEEYTNVFTSGNVEIQLNVNTTVVNESPVTLPKETVYPGLKVAKDTSITNIGSEAAYVGAVITMTYTDAVAAASLINLTGDNAGTTDMIEVDITSLFGGLVTEDDNYTVYTGTVANGFAIYVVKDEALAGKTDSTTYSADLFDTFDVSADWDNAEMAALGNWTLSVKAYAVQTAGMTSGALAALQEAFPGVFPNNT